MAALAQAQAPSSSASISHHSIRNALAVASPRSHKTAAAFRISTSLPTISLFATGSPLVVSRTSYRIKRGRGHATSVPIRCEQSTEEGNSVDVWLGRLAMVGFAVAITVEISTGKGLLENFGLTSPLPTVALAVTALVGVLTALFIFQSASKN